MPTFGDVTCGLRARQEQHSKPTCSGAFPVPPVPHRSRTLRALEHARGPAAASVQQRRSRAAFGRVGLREAEARGAWGYVDPASSALFCGLVKQYLFRRQTSPVCQTPPAFSTGFFLKPTGLSVDQPTAPGYSTSLGNINLDVKPRCKVLANPQRRVARICAQTLVSARRANACRPAVCYFVSKWHALENAEPRALSGSR